MIRVKRARWAQGPSRPGRTVKHPCAIYLSGRTRAAFLISHIALCVTAGRAQPGIRARKNQEPGRGSPAAQSLKARARFAVLGELAL